MERSFPAHAHKNNSVTAESSSDFISTAEAARILNVSVYEIRKQLKRGELKGHRKQSGNWREWQVDKASMPKRRVTRYSRPHVLPWSTWLDRLPSLAGLNRRDVRNIAALFPGKFQLAEMHTSYLPSIELFRLRRELRAQAKVKRELLLLRRELIQKTHGWLLNDDGSVICKNEPCMLISVEIEKIKKTLSIFEQGSIDIERAVAKFQQRL
jgi:hypothetical protein